MQMKHNETRKKIEPLKAGGQYFVTNSVNLTV